MGPLLSLRQARRAYDLVARPACLSSRDVILRMQKVGWAYDPLPGDAAGTAIEGWPGGSARIMLCPDNRHPAAIVST